MKKSYDRMDGHTFEHYCAGLLRRNGFHHVEVTRGSGNQGIDILAWKHRKKYGIQCKCYSYYLGNKAIQEAFGVQDVVSSHDAGTTIFSAPEKVDEDKIRQVIKDAGYEVTGITQE